MKNTIKGMTTCNVCGRDFPLIAEEHYVSKEPGKIGFAAITGGTAPMLWDSFDCPHCGCQNLVQQRNRLSDIFGQDLPLDDDEEDEDEDAPVCPFPKGGECYCKDTCNSECEFHPDHSPQCSYTGECYCRDLCDKTCEFHPEYNPHSEREEKD